MKKITLIVFLFFYFFESNSQTILSENFDTALNWSVVNLSAGINAGWSRQTAGIYPTCDTFAGAGMVRFNSYSISASSQYELNSPAMTFTGGSYRFKFNLFKDADYSANNDRVEIYYNTVPGSAGGTLLGTVSRYATVKGWNSFTYLIPGNPNGSGYISLKATSEYGNNIFIDELLVENVPPCADPTALVANGITSSGATVSWTAPTAAPANGYEYYYALTAAVPTSTTLANGSVAAGIVTKTITGLNAATNYYFYVRAVCSASITSSWSNGILCTTACATVATLNENFDSATRPFLPICWSKIISGPTISSFASVGTVSTFSSTPNGVSLYNSSSTEADDIMLVTPKLTNLSTGLNRLKFNSKTDTLGEDVVVGTLTNPLDPTTFTPLQTVVLSTDYASFTINFSSYTGSNTYIAFRKVNTSTYTTVYLDDIIWEPIPSCVEPTTLVASAITSSGATISWTAPAVAPANGYEYYFTLTAAAPTSTTTPNGSVAAAIITKTITGLNPATNYYFYVRAVCSASNASPWSNGILFTTACVPVSTINENFDSVTRPALPFCWSKILSGSTISAYASVETVSTSSSTPNGVLLYNSSSTEGDDIMLVTPQLTNLSTGLNRLKFNARTGTLGQDIVIGTLTNPSDPTTFSPLQRIVLTTAYAPYTVNFSSYTGSNTYIAFRRFSTSTYTSVYLDDIIWEPIPSCVEPTAPLFSSITASGATISWTATATAPANGYAYYVSTTATAPTSTSIPTGTVGAGITTAILTGLNPATYYYFWVRASCSASLSSQWSVSRTFLTMCVPVATLPWQENFDTLTTLGTSNFPPCWSKENGDWATSNATDYNTARSGTNYLRDSWTATNEYMWTPGFSLIAGISYDLSYWTQGDGGTGWIVDTYISNTQLSTPTTPTQLGATYLYPSSSTLTPGAYVQVKNTFTVASNGTYYFAIRVNQPSNIPYFVAFDDFKLDVTPACTEPSSVTSSGITTTGATVSWAGPASATSGYDYYVSVNSVVPTATTIPTGAVSSGITTVTVSGLSGQTNYYFWVRSKCAAAATSNWWGASFTTLCQTASVPHSLNFETAAIGQIPICTTIVNEGSGNQWSVINAPGNGFTSKCLSYRYNFLNEANAWFYSNAIALVAGTNYTISYKYGNSSPVYIEKLKVAYGTAKTSAAMINVLGDYSAITGTSPSVSTVIFTPPTSGSYYVGFKAYSAANQEFLYIDDIMIDVSLSNAAYKTDAFTFYPNPVTNILHLQYSDTILSVTVFNLLGQEVLIKTVNASQSQIDMSDLTAGIYIVKVSIDGLEKVIKVNKK